MEVVTATPLPKMGGSDSPFRDHDVREWSRLDTITGALERARLETDSWTASTKDVCHKYGKVLDTRSRTTLDGSLAAAASRKFEVFQSKSTAGSTRVQVVKTQTVSSSRWSGRQGQEGLSGTGHILNDFQNLQLAVNPLDLTSQKSKASVGRSASRRPPTRRQREASSPPKVDLSDPFKQHFTAAQNLNRVSRLCHQIHESAVRHAFGVTTPTPSISERESGDGSASGVEIVEIESSINGSNATNSSTEKTTRTNENCGKVTLARTKSTSSENLNQVIDKENQSDFEDLETWRRESKVRRSLQFPKQNKTHSKAKPPDLPENSVNVRKIREELEKGRRLSTALRNSSLDLVTLDQIIQSVSSNSSIDKTSSADENQDENVETARKIKQKRDSFVTVESINEVKGRLRKTSSPSNDNVLSNNKKEEADNNINKATMKNDQNVNQSKVKLYVFGMENTLQQNKKPFPISGSLESKSKNLTTNHKNEDWYNRRKSYGFEKVQNDVETNENSLKAKKKMESSTDSGICRSSEMVLNQRKSDSSDTDHSSDNKTTPNGISYGKVKKMTSIFSQKENEENSQLDDFGTLNQKKKEENDHLDNLSSQWTKRIGDWKSNDATKDAKLSSITVTLRTNRDEDNEVKRHSIACDDFNYGTVEPTENRFRKTSLINSTDQLIKPDLSDDNTRKTKKVEFCKTEIHFAAETGTVNIVETDEKPPPSQNFRRRRRNSGPTINYNHFSSKNGLPVTHFGDNSLENNESFEKIMFGISDDENSDSRVSPEPLKYDNDEPRVPPIYGQLKNNYETKPYTIKKNYQENIQRDTVNAECDNIKGILKNKPIKPKPYLLGDIPLSSDSDGETHPWNIKPPIRMFDDVHNKFKSVINSNEIYTDFDSKYKSTIHNPKTNANDKPKYQSSLKTVRPTKFPEQRLHSDSLNTRYSDSFTTNLRVSPVTKDKRPYSWSVNDNRNNSDEETSYPVEDAEENGWVPAKEAEIGNIQESRRSLSPGKIKQSPLPLRKTSLPSHEVSSSSFPKDNLSSPSLVTKSFVPNYAVVSKSNRTRARSKSPLNKGDSKIHKYENVLYGEIQKTTNKKHRDLSPLKDKRINSHYEEVLFRHSNDLNKKVVRDLSPNKQNVVLRQPKDFEMTYFGIKSDQKSSADVKKKIISNINKPDLIQHCNKRTPSPKRNKKPQHSYVGNVTNDHIYENVNFKSTVTKKEFDNSILDELTKAADQILEAVNGYNKDESNRNKFDSDEEYKKPLDTISETKSWKTSNIAIHARKPTLASAAKVRVKRTSSTSSVESLSRDRRGSFGISNERQTKEESLRVGQKHVAKKNALSDSSSTKTSTKVTRRLQRACSREALLQSHGSSSEDLPIQVETPVRKPRLLKKTKTSQLAVNSGIDIKKPDRGIKMENGKHQLTKAAQNFPEERGTNIIPEIKQKNPISAIRHPPIEEMSRGRSRPRSVDRSSRYSSKKESSKGTVASSSRSTSKQSYQPTSRLLEPPQKENANVTQHRISTANIKKCKSTEGTRIKH